MFKKIFWTAAYFLSPLIPIIVILASLPDKFNSLSTIIPMILGATSYVWFVNQFILSARPKFVEKHFGMDRIFRFHTLMAIVSAVLALLHKLSKEAIMGESFTTQVGDAAFAIFMIVMALSLIFIADSVLLKIKPIFIIRQYINKNLKLKYKTHVIIHNISMAATIIMFVHIMLGSASRTAPAVKITFAVYFALGFAFYIYHKIIKKFILDKNMFVVKDVIRETSNMWTLKLESEKGKVIDYKPGQFMFLKLFGNDFDIEEHPFSISSSPSKKGYISVTIKELGDYTRKIGNVRKGFKAHVDAPYGHFSYLNCNKQSDIVFIAGGVGITPVLSMLRYMNDMDKDKKAILIWGVRNTGEIICTDEFEKFTRDMKKFSFVPVVSNDESYDGEKGRIDRNKIEKILSEHEYCIDSSEFFVCGPPPMMNSVIKILNSIGVKSSHIHFEKFSL